MYKLVLANDIGNDKMKILEPGAPLRKIPSVYKRLMKKPDVHETDVEKNVVNLLDQLVVHITSESIKRDGTYMIGKRAMQSAKSIKNMDIVNGEKHKDDLPLINTLGYAAARTVQKAYKKEGTLPSVVHSKVFMSSAIPASQHTSHTAKHLEERFTGADKSLEHVVIVYVGDKAVTVQLQFEWVKVTKEGIPALYAIIEGSEDMFKEFSKTYYEGKEITGEYFENKKMMHLDIGSGTTEKIYTEGMEPKPDVCTGDRLGVGHAVDEALKEFKRRSGNIGDIKRQQFVDIIENPEDNEKDYELAKEILEEARIDQAEQILENGRSAYTQDFSSKPEIITVYGGGSIEFRDEMYEELVEFSDAVRAKVLWIPEKYAVEMNVRGLDVLNQNMFLEDEYEEALEELEENSVALEQ
ncbi:ParM/StbA family protein [Priestia endophytica]